MKTLRILSLAIALAFSGCPDNSTTPTPTPSDFVFGSTKTQTLSSASATSVTDSTTNMRFVFPNGAHGNLVLTQINVAQSKAMSGSEIFALQASYSGTERVRIAIAKTRSAHPRLCAWMTPPALSHDKSKKTWITLPLLDSNASEYLYDVVLASSPNASRKGSSIQEDVAGSTAVLSFGDNDPVAEATLRSNMTADLQSLRSLMTATMQSHIDVELNRIPATVSIVPASGTSAYTPHWSQFSGWWSTRGSLELRSNIERNRITHEVGHYMHHLLRGDAEFKNVLNTSQSVSAASHAIGDVYDRKTIIEEYPYYFEYALNRSVNLGGTSSFDPEDPMSASGFMQYTFGKVDFPSMEGFGVVMLAQLHSSRRSVTTHYTAYNGKKVTSDDAIPNVGASHSEICQSIVQSGYQSTDELLTKMQNMLSARGEAEKLPVLMERIGWSYKLTGRLLWKTSEIEPIADVHIQPVVRIGTTEYTCPETVTGADGSFTIPRSFPQAQVKLRIKISSVAYLTDIDTLINIPSFDTRTSTTTGFALGDIAIDPPVVPAVGGRWEVYQMILPASSCSGCGATSFGAPLSLAGRFYLLVDGQGNAQSDGASSSVLSYESANIGGSIRVNPKYRLVGDTRYLINLNYTYRRDYSNANLNVSGTVISTPTSNVKFNGSLKFVVYTDEKKEKESCSCIESPSVSCTVGKIK